MHRALLLTVVLLTAGLAGCVGGDETSGNPELDSTPDLEEGTGGIQGIVTDEAVQPLEGITVTLVETGETTETVGDGSFAFSNVQPASYTLRFEADGFIGKEEPVTVTSGEITQLEVLMAHKPTVNPFSQTIEFQGFIECSTRTTIGIAVCAIPNIFLGGNATNDRFLFPYPIEANPWQMVTEITWEANQPLGQRLSVVNEPRGLPNDDKTEFGDTVGESPLIFRTDRERFAEVDKNTTAVCEGEKDPESQISAEQDDYCNRNYIEEGGEGYVRVFVAGEDTGADWPEPVPLIGGSSVTVGAAVQQDYQLFITTFYNAPACEDYSLVEQNTCEQQAAPPDEDPADEIGGSSNSSDESGG